MLDKHGHRSVILISYLIFSSLIPSGWPVQPGSELLLYEGRLVAVWWPTFTFEKDHRGPRRPCLHEGEHMSGEFHWKVQFTVSESFFLFFFCILFQKLSELWSSRKLFFRMLNCWWYCGCVKDLTPHGNVGNSRTLLFVYAVSSILKHIFQNIWLIILPFYFVSIVFFFILTELVLLSYVVINHVIISCVS